MLVARVICSDEGCAHEEVAETACAEELDALACACGCALQVLGWPEVLEDDGPVPGAEVIAFPVERTRRPAWEQRLAS